MPGLASDVAERIKRSVIATGAEVGPDGLTVALICAHAEVSPAAFPQLWRDPIDALLEALDERLRQPVVPDTGRLLDDLIALAQGYLQLYEDPIFTALMFRLLAAVRQDQDFARRVGPGYAARRATNSVLIERAIQRGELAAGFDPDAIFDPMLAVVFAWTGQGKVPTRQEISLAMERVIGEASLQGRGEPS